LAILSKTSRKRHHDFFTELRNRTDQSIHDALLHDMNTPEVLAALRQMCTQARGYLTNNEEEDVPEELVLTANEMLLTTMGRLGVDLNGSGGGSDGGDSEMEVARAFAEFRRSVREAAKSKSSPGEFF
jgi:cysteinyl-tRNA synthetase